MFWLIYFWLIQDLSIIYIYKFEKMNKSKKKKKKLNTNLKKVKKS